MEFPADPVLPAPPAIPSVPGWALPRGPVTDPCEAAYMAGAALNSLDHLVRSEPVWAGAWRQRLALKAAAAAARLCGHREDEAALRDAWHLRPSEVDPGPAGHLLAAWRRLAARSPVLGADEVASLTHLLGLGRSETFQALPAIIDEAIGTGRPAPLAAAAVAGRVATLGAHAEVLAWWCADLVLSARMRWPVTVPILAAQVHAPVLRAGSGRGRLRPGGDGFERGLCLAAAIGTAEACRLARDIAGRARQLAAVAPKLRTKGAGEVIRLLLEDDAVPGAVTTNTLSRWATRRLFERLTTLEAVRELSGRPTFRLYGL
ncbi:MAG: hypothetical protein B7Y12_02460 [Rhizobiales bacterium 24-66-13]|jgi:hypothetical protein|nr:MAG: hypothetical protein B7Y12_02460 [Rhizobiales bacterium 24-66-13]OZB11654.1 MAG: hypothetical protein B7X67_02970 [Rhizobiales bacterium 39-66-18]HQS45877.1 DUF1403 family protein [Xanthobacteraceae bacterium]